MTENSSGRNGPVQQGIDEQDVSESADPPFPAGIDQRVYIGRGVAPGIAMGKAHVFSIGSPGKSQDAESEALDTEAEVRRLHEAIERAEQELKKIREFTREKLGSESAEIFEAQRLMLRDELVLESIEEVTREKTVSAEQAVQTVLSAHQRRLEAKGNDFLRERASDLADVQDRLLQNLRRDQILDKVEERSVIVAPRLSAADLILLSRRDIQGCVIGEGGRTSHVAIIARSLGLPTVMSASEAVADIQDGQPLIVDGIRGRVIANPLRRVEEAYRDQLKEHELNFRRQRHWRHHPAETRDGREITLRANIEFTQETDLLEDCGAEGIGLFRTEMLLMISGISTISEEDSYETYRHVIEQANPYPTMLRLLDLGGDKLLPRAHREHNPFLGWRGIRVLLDKPDVLKKQLRAALRASAHGEVRLLLPMITDLAEVQTVREHILQIQQELQAEGKACAEAIELGIMVEVPNVALQAQKYAEEVDFFSIGTNDLTQYVLAVDRGNDMVAERYSHYHPAVLLLIQSVVQAAEKAGIPVSICGEMAGEPRAVPVLVGLGLTELSASPAYLPEIKQAVRSISFEEVQVLAKELLDCASATETESLLMDWIEAHAPRIDALMGSELLDEVLGS